MAKTKKASKAARFWQRAIVDAEELIQSVKAEARARARELKESVVLLEELRDNNVALPSPKMGTVHLGNCVESELYHYEVIDPRDVSIRYPAKHGKEAQNNSQTG